MGTLIPVLSLAFTYETHPPFPSPHTSELTHTLRTNDPQPKSNRSGLLFLSQRNSNTLSLPLTLPYDEPEVHPWAQKGLGALGLVSAGCHGLMKAV